LGNYQIGKIWILNLAQEWDNKTIPKPQKPFQNPFPSPINNIILPSQHNFPYKLPPKKIQPITNSDIPITDRNNKFPIIFNKGPQPIPYGKKKVPIRNFEGTISGRRRFLKNRGLIGANYRDGQVQLGVASTFTNKTFS
jgi:hypothetical protein